MNGFRLIFIFILMYNCSMVAMLSRIVHQSTQVHRLSSVLASTNQDGFSRYTNALSLAPLKDMTHAPMHFSSSAERGRTKIETKINDTRDLVKRTAFCTAAGIGATGAGYAVEHAINSLVPLSEWCPHILQPSVAVIFFLSTMGGSLGQVFGPIVAAGGICGLVSNSLYLAILQLKRQNYIDKCALEAECVALAKQRNAENSRVALSSHQKD